MRMPIFSYFVVVGAVLTGLLIWFGDDGELASAPLRTSQQAGIPKRSKAKPETSPAITPVNFGATAKSPAPSADRPRERPARAPAQPKPRQKTVVRTWQSPARNWVAADYGHGTLGIH